MSTNTQRAASLSINDYFISDVLVLAVRLMDADPCLTYHAALQQAKYTIGKGLP